MFMTHASYGNGWNRPRSGPGAAPPEWAGLNDDLLLVPRRDGVRVVTQFGEDFVGVLTEQWRSLDVRLERRELDRAADGEVRAAALLLDLDDAAAGAQVLVLGEILHGHDRGARHLPL